MYQVVMYDFASDAIFIATFEGPLALLDAQNFAKSLRPFFEGYKVVPKSTTGGFDVMYEYGGRKAEVEVKEKN